MPWRVSENHSECPSSRPWAVVKDDTGEVEGCHPSREAANDQLAALHAAEADQELQTMANDIVIQLGGKPNPGTPKDRRLHENEDEKKCPEGQHLMPDGSCMPDDEMSADADTVTVSEDLDIEAELVEMHGSHNQGSHGGKGGGKGGAPKVKPEAAKHVLPTQRDVSNYKQKVRQEKKERQADAARAQKQIKKPGRRRRGGGPPLVDIDAMFPAGAEVTEMDVEIELEDLTGPTLAWEGVLAVEGVETGDGREFTPGSLEWPDLDEVIVPLMWQERSEPKHGNSVMVGRIQRVWRVDDQVWGNGVIKSDAEVVEDIRAGLAGGISVDVDSVKNHDVEQVYEDVDEGVDVQDDIVSLFGPPPDKVRFHRGRLRGATLVALPAFVEARISLVDEESEGLVAAAIPIDPPATWFADPQLVGPTPWTVTDEGHVFGHLALWSTCHQTFPDRCITPPRERDFPYFMRRELKTADGDIIGVGPITMGTGHASTRLGARPAAEHYDDTGAAVCDVIVGTDRFGIWIAGALRHDVDPGRLRALRGAALSGDWRRIGGQLRLVAVLAVNVPGFPIPRMATYTTDARDVALVAAGVVTEERIELVREAMARRDEDGVIYVRRVTSS